MALLADDGWIKVEDLSEEDSGILELAQKEGVDLAAKLKLAIGDIRSEVHGFLRKYSVFGSRNAVVNWDLARWGVYQTLGSAYRDAYFHQLNDRYSAKWKLFTQQAKDAKETCWAKGVGVVSRPLARPAEPEVEVLAGEQQPRDYWVALAWVMPNGQESAAGSARLVRTTGIHRLVVRPGQPMPEGASWHLYAGAGPLEMSRQTIEPRSVETAWELPDTGLAEGAAASEGQEAESVVRPRRLLRRN